MNAKESMMRLAKGETLSVGELQDLETWLGKLERLEQYYGKSLRNDGSVGFGEANFGSAFFDVPVTRGITYSFVTNGSVADGVWTDLAFSDSRGYIKESDACVVRKPGTTNEWMRNRILPANTSIVMIGEITWDLVDPPTSESQFEVDLDYYVNGVYDTSYFSYQASTIGWVTNLVVAHDTIQDNETIKLSVWQGSGVTLDTVSANLHFFIA